MLDYSYLGTGNKWNLNQTEENFIEEAEFENVVWKMAAI